MNGRVHLSTVVLATIGAIDLVSTLMLMNVGAREANPIFGPLAAYGSLPFALAKLVFLIGPILLLEFVRTKHPQTAEQGTWVAAGAYFLLYATHLIRLSG